MSLPIYWCNDAPLESFIIRKFRAYSHMWATGTGRWWWLGLSTIAGRMRVRCFTSPTRIMSLLCCALPNCLTCLLCTQEEKKSAPAPGWLTDLLHGSPATSMPQEQQVCMCVFQSFWGGVPPPMVFNDLSTVGGWWVQSGYSNLALFYQHFSGATLSGHRVVVLRQLRNLGSSSLLWSLY